MEQKRHTALERYRSMRQDIEATIQGGLPSVELSWRYQELLYRISVIETCQAFQKAAPFSADPKELIPHYKLVSTYFLLLMSERRLSLTEDDETRRRQDTAHESLKRVVEDHLHRFRHYAPHGPEQYQQDIRNLICTVLPAWMQYRESLVPIKMQEEVAQ